MKIKLLLFLYSSHNHIDEGLDATTTLVQETAFTAGHQGASSEPNV